VTANKDGLDPTLQIPRLGKGLKTAVVGLFRLIRKTARRQLFAPEMILQAFAADALAAASRIAAIAKIHVCVFFTVHHIVLSAGVHTLVCNKRFSTRFRLNSSIFDATS
jgi:hypothetical protein